MEKLFKVKYWDYSRQPFNLNGHISVSYTHLVPKRKQYKLVLNSDDVKYGGAGEKRPEIYKAVSKECDGKKYSFAYPLPAYGVAVFEF